MVSKYHKFVHAAFKDNYLIFLTHLYRSAILQNEITGEHTCIVLKPLQSDDVEGVAGVSGGWLSPFNQGAFLYITSKFSGPV